MAAKISSSLTVTRSSATSSMMAKTSGSVFLVASPSAIVFTASRLVGRPSRRLEAMLADPAVDVVTIAPPSGAHMEPAVAAARAGKHVIVEKPLEVTLRRCDRIIKECEKAGVVLSTIFPSRFHDSCREIKRAIDQDPRGVAKLGEMWLDEEGA